MRYKGIIFDLDGVICSTDEYHYMAWKALADRLGLPFDRRKNNLLRGIGRMESLEIVLGDSACAYSVEERQKLAEEKNALYRKLLGRMTPADLPQETRDALDSLKKAGVRLAVGSSSRNTMFILERLELKGLFDGIVDGNRITRAKPDPEVFLKAAASLGLQPCECLVVEDARAGVEAAKRGGFSCTAIGDAANNPGADYYICSISDIWRIP